MAVPKPIAYIAWAAVGLTMMGAGATAVALMATTSNAVTETGGAAVVILPDSIDGFDRGQEYAKKYLQEKRQDR